MANDRIYFKCKHCEKQTLLFKYYPSANPGLWDSDELEEFINEHIQCSPNFGRSNLGGDRCFDLVAESAMEIVTK
jgi:hypothetical protein